MGLYGEYFHAIKVSKKTVEVRLNDEKRRKIKVGDTIEFIKVHQQDEILKVRVTDLRSFDTFEVMYIVIPLSDYDCEELTMKDRIYGTYEIYTSEQEKEWRTLAIMIEY